MKTEFTIPEELSEEFTNRLILYPTGYKLPEGLPKKSTHSCLNLTEQKFEPYFSSSDNYHEIIILGVVSRIENIFDFWRYIQDICIANGMVQIIDTFYSHLDMTDSTHKRNVSEKTFRLLSPEERAGMLTDPYEDGVAIHMHNEFKFKIEKSMFYLENKWECRSNMEQSVALFHHLNSARKVEITMTCIK